MNGNGAIKFSCWRATGRTPVTRLLAGICLCLPKVSHRQGAAALRLWFAFLCWYSPRCSVPSWSASPVSGRASATSASWPRHLRVPSSRGRIYGAVFRHLCGTELSGVEKGEENRVGQTEVEDPAEQLNIWTSRAPTRRNTDAREPNARKSDAADLTGQTRHGRAHHEVSGGGHDEAGFSQGND